MKRENKAILGWALYDWANSAFATTVMAGFFPVFFKQYWSQAANANVSTARLGFGNSASGLAIALLAPCLGALADRCGIRKKLLFILAGLGIAATACLWGVGEGAWMPALMLYVLGIIGFCGANALYDSFLPSLTDERHMDVVSSIGYSLGYLGGGILFLLNVLMTLFPASFGFNDPWDAMRWSFLSVAVWWAVFSIPMLLWVPEPSFQRSATAGGGISAAWSALRSAGATAWGLRKEKPILFFLLAYWFYIDGVDTVIRMAVDYGMSIGFKRTDLILALLIVQFVGFPAALVFGKIGQKWGPRGGLFIGIGAYELATLWGTLMKTRYEFYGLAIMIGLFQGGIQSLSRSFFARLIPAERSAEYYGLYNMLGKFAVILGPALVGGVNLVSRRILMPDHATVEQANAVGLMASRCGMASLILLFFAGAVLLCFVSDRNTKPHPAKDQA